MQVNVSSKQFRADEKLVAYTEKKINKLTTFFDRIIDSRVSLKLENSGQVKDKIVEVSVNVPGQTLFASETHKTFEGAVDLVTDDLKRQLKRYKDKIRN